MAAIKLVKNNFLGYGFGFVEAYFANSSLIIKGLGEGINSVFAGPLDLFIIAGAAGVVFWLVFFVGIGNGTIMTLLPIAALSLLNPVHQSELVYFFIGMLVSKTHSISGARAVRCAHRAYNAQVKLDTPITAFFSYW